MFFLNLWVETNFCCGRFAFHSLRQQKQSKRAAFCFTSPDLNTSDGNRQEGDETDRRRWRIQGGRGVAAVAKQKAKKALCEAVTATGPNPSFSASKKRHVKACCFFNCKISHVTTIKTLQLLFKHQTRSINEITA